jgi:hypothetical protein
MNDRFADLDELVLRCRDKEAREYIREAVACYRGGAFRSCIVASWIAVVFDFIRKLKDLELYGDKNARRKLEEFRKARTSNDIATSLEFERSVLQWAETEFEFISPVERQDLERLYQDRNRCAHATMTLEEAVFAPSAELARTHLRTVVDHFLCHPPTQGKQAVDFLVGQVGSAYFPRSVDAAIESFSRGPLLRARKSLVRNFAIVLIKTYIFGELTDAERAKFACALSAVRKMHGDVVGEVFATKLCDIYRAELRDAHMRWATRLLTDVPEAADLITDDIRSQIQRYVEDMPFEDCSVALLGALDLTPLRPQAVTRLGALTRAEMAQLMEIDGFRRQELLAPALDLYGTAGSFNSANDVARGVLLPLIEFFTADDVRRVVQIAAKNDEVLFSFALFSLLETLRAAHLMSTDEFDGLIDEHNLCERNNWTTRLGEPQPEDEHPF